MNTGDAAGRPDSVAELALRLPEPAQPIATSPVLIEAEKEMLARCEAAVDSLALSFWLAGKALHVVRDGRLYRETHETFEEYVQARWGMKRNYANKLIRTWRIAEAVFDSKSNALVTIGTTATREQHAQQVATLRRELNQAMVWELVAVAEKHSPEVAAGVLGMVVEVDGKPTAAVVKRAVRALPDSEKFDPKAAKAVIREELAKPASAPSARPPRPRQEQQPATPAGPDVAWGDPAAVYALLLEKMTAENRAALATLLIEDIPSGTPAGVAS
ncbi:hypothetical protein ACIBCA_36335 [Kitasatospora sp. NPDC051170]|uniref:hypothetical protein n=1 Tax=Kitasatospora sp. NPDC051170 TaxID=3364056 RepID=UPI00378C4C50